MSDMDAQILRIATLTKERDGWMTMWNNKVGEIDVLTKRLHSLEEGVRCAVGELERLISVVSDPDADCVNACLATLKPLIKEDK